MDTEVLDYQWETEVRTFVAKRRNGSPTLADDSVKFFARAFVETRCQKKAWFGVHSASISLVVGGIYLASIVPSSGDTGVWLLIDRTGPPIDGVDYRPVKATLPSDSPLIWAHVWDVAQVSRLTDCDELWTLYGLASEEIFQYSIASGRDQQQLRRGKRRLLEFWAPQDRRAFSFPEEVDSNEVFFEGAKRQIMVNSYERDPGARLECIARNKARCKACKFDFEVEFGEIGAGYIHVHHQRPLAEIGEQYEVDPKLDLIPVCPNCHAMLHRRSPPYTIEELKAIMLNVKEQRSDNQ